MGGDIRRQASSPLLLIAAILLTAATALGLIADIFRFTLSRLLKMLVPWLESTSGLSDVFRIASLLQYLPRVLLIAALFTLFVSAVNRRQPVMSTAGCTLVKITMVIRLGYTGLVAIGALAFMVLLTKPMSAHGSYSLAGTLIMIGLWLLLVCPIALLLCFCYLKAVRDMRILSAALRGTPLPNTKLSMAVPVMLFVSAAISLVELSVSALMLAAAQVLLGLLLLRCRKDLALSVLI